MCSQIPGAFLLLTVYSLSSFLSLLMLLVALLVVFPYSSLCPPQDVSHSRPYLLLLCIGDLKSASAFVVFGRVLLALWAGIQWDPSETAEVSWQVVSSAAVPCIGVSCGLGLISLNISCASLAKGSSLFSLWKCFWRGSLNCVFDREQERRGGNQSYLGQLILQLTVSLYASYSNFLFSEDDFCK